MNSKFVYNLLKNLRGKKQDKGFTLIELLVVVIIIGVLAAVALPNLLAQVGKARETEGKTGVGTINRAQQTFHFENQEFVEETIDTDAFKTIDNELGVAVMSDYFDFESARDNEDFVVQTASTSEEDAKDNGVRQYSGAVSFNGGSYETALCQMRTIGESPEPPTPGPNNTVVCNENATELK